MVEFIADKGKIVSLFVVWEWGHDGLFVMSFKFWGCLTINNRLKWLSLFLTRKKSVVHLHCGNGGHDDVLMIFSCGLWKVDSCFVG